MPGSGRAPRSSLETNYDITESLASLDKKMIVYLRYGRNLLLLGIYKDGTVISY